MSGPNITPRVTLSLFSKEPAFLCGGGKDGDVPCLSPMAVPLANSKQNGGKCNSNHYAIIANGLQERAGVSLSSRF